MRAGRQENHIFCGARKKCVGSRNPERQFSESNPARTSQEGREPCFALALRVVWGPIRHRNENKRTPSYVLVVWDFLPQSVAESLQPLFAQRGLLRPCRQRGHTAHRSASGTPQGRSTCLSRWLGVSLSFPAHQRA